MDRTPIKIPPVLALIIDAAQYRGCRCSDILCDRRTEVRTRFAIMWVASVAHRLSLPKIGKEMGGLHHTTCLNGIRRAETYRRTDKDFHQMAEWLLDRAMKRIELEQMEMEMAA